MRNLVLGAVMAAAMALSAPAATAESNYTTTDVVDFFLNSVDLGATRGICIGTVQECTPTAQPQGFDMLITFDLDSAVLSGAARTNLDQVARALEDQRLASARFDIEGHTDAIGLDGYNMDLSRRRAASVLDYLVEKGVDAERLTAIGLGKTAPRVDDPFDAINRRVEMRISVR